jgi:hypothetical protein
MGKAFRSSGSSSVWHFPRTSRALGIFAGMVVVMIRTSTFILIALLLQPDSASGQVKTEYMSAREGAPLLMSLFSRAGASGSLAYSGRCDKETHDLPLLKANVTKNNSIVHNLRAMLSSDRGMEVEEDVNGLIRITERNVPRDLLNVRIKNLAFVADPGPSLEAENVHSSGQEGLYNPSDALGHILSAPEVVNFRRIHNIGPFTFQMATGIRETALPNSPHVSGTLTDVSLSQALDYVLRTFPGIWVYENCSNKGNARAVFWFYENGPEWEVLRIHSASSSR